MELSEGLRELFINQVETVNSALIALAGCIDEEGDVRNMVLRTGMTAANGLLRMTETWMYEPEEQEDPLPWEDVDAPVRGPNTDDPATCGHHPPYFDLPGQTMCQTCGASRLDDGTWKVL